MKATVLKCKGLDMQVCVPTYWSDTQVKEFAEKENPCGTELGWHILKNGDSRLGKDPERNPCGLGHDFVHVALIA